MQLAGCDQIGNASIGLEYGRKRSGINDMCGLFIPLICDANGNKFGKSENGKAVFLDSRITTPYEFYQFWLNQSDEDAKRFIKMFTLLSKDEIEALIEEHEKAPHTRLLQKRLAKEVTTFVHSKEECDLAIEASNVLFGNATHETLAKLDNATILDVFNGVPKFAINKDVLREGIKLSELAVEKLNIFKSKGELKKLIANGGISINKLKISEDVIIDANSLLNDTFLLLQQGKKYYKLVIAN